VNNVGYACSGTLKEISGSTMHLKADKRKLQVLPGSVCTTFLNPSDQIWHQGSWIWHGSDHNLWN